MVLPLIGLLAAGLGSLGAMGVGQQFLGEWVNRRQAREREGMTGLLGERGLLTDQGGLLRDPYGGGFPGDMITGYGAPGFGMPGGQPVMAPGLLGGQQGGYPASEAPPGPGLTGGYGMGGIPDFVTPTIQLESGGDPNAVNQAGSGARGLIQFMPDTLAGLKDRLGIAGLSDDEALASHQPALINAYAEDVMANYVPGQTVNGIPVTPDVYFGVGTLGGPEGARRWLESGGKYNPKDKSGVTLSDRAAEIAGMTGGGGYGGIGLQTGGGGFAQDVYGGTRPEDLQWAGWQTGLIDELPLGFEGANRVAAANQGWNEALLGERGANARTMATLAQRSQEAQLLASTREQKPPEPYDWGDYGQQISDLDNQYLIGGQAQELAQWGQENFGRGIDLAGDPNARAVLSSLAKTLTDYSAISAKNLTGGEPSDTFVTRIADLYDLPEKLTWTEGDIADLMSNPRKWATVIQMLEMERGRVRERRQQVYNQGYVYSRGGDPAPDVPERAGTGMPQGFQSGIGG